MLDWDLLFSWLELADLFWVHNLSCSLFLGFRFSLSSHASASWPVLSSSSQALSPWRLSPKILYTAAPGLNPLLKILGKSRLTTLQEASTRLSKAAMQKKKPTPEDSDKLKKKRSPHVPSRAGVESRTTKRMSNWTRESEAEPNTSWFLVRVT